MNKIVPLGRYDGEIMELYRHDEYKKYICDSFAVHSFKIFKDIRILMALLPVLKEDDKRELLIFARHCLNADKMEEWRKNMAVIK